MTDDPTQHKSETLAPWPRYNEKNINALFISSETDERDAFLRLMRDAILAELDAIERMLGMVPTTADIRKQFRRNGSGR